MAKAESFDIDNMLKERGVPNELITTMSEEQKFDIYYNDLVFDSYKKVTLDEGLSDEYKSKNNVSNDSGLLRASIPSNDMEFYISTYKAAQYDDRSKIVTVYANYRWINEPYFRLTDCFGLSWDETIWRPVDNSAAKMSSYTLANGSTVLSPSNSLEYISNSGCGWDTNIKYYADGPTDIVAHNDGWGRIKLQAKKPSKSGTTQFFAKYAHVKVGGSVGLSFYGVNIEVVGSGSYDETGTSKTFFY